MRRALGRSALAAIGYACSPEGDGVAYVSLNSARTGPDVLRVAFACVPTPALLGRDVAYAALLAVAAELVARGISSATLEVQDDDLVLDVAGHRSVPAALAVPYVMLGCALNRFETVRVVRCSGHDCIDLTARARAEALLHVAA